MSSTAASSSSPTPTAPRTRRADRRLFRLILTGATLNLACGLAFLLAPGLDHTLAALILWLVAFGGLLAVPLSGVIIPVFSRRPANRRARRTNVEALFCMIWSTLTVSVSQLSGFWATSQPTWHFAASALIAAIPLTAVAALVYRQGAGSRRSFLRLS